MAPAFQKTLKLNPAIINYGKFSYLKLDNAVSLQPRILCPVINPYEHPYTLAWSDDTFCYVEGQTLTSKILHSQTTRIWLAKSSSYHWIAIFVCTILYPSITLSHFITALKCNVSLYILSLYHCTKLHQWIAIHCIDVPLQCE